MIACKIIQGLLMAVGGGGPSYSEFCDFILFISRGVRYLLSITVNLYQEVFELNNIELKKEIKF